MFLFLSSAILVTIIADIAVKRGRERERERERSTSSKDPLFAIVQESNIRIFPPFLRCLLRPTVASRREKLEHDAIADLAIGFPPFSLRALPAA